MTGRDPISKWEVIGADGSYWCIQSPDPLEAGAEGAQLGVDPKELGDVPVKTIYNATAFQEGATYGGKRVMMRNPVLMVKCYDRGDGVADTESRWRMAWDYDTDTTIRISTDGARPSVRTIKLRLGKEPDVITPLSKDMRLIDRCNVVLTLAAGDPFFYEPDALDHWTATTSNDASGTVTISNPTDQKLWLQWELTAPGIWRLPDYSFGDNSKGWAVEHANRIIVLPSLGTGQHVNLDTYPDNERIDADDESLVWARMRAIEFLYPVPPYTAPIELPVRVTNGPVGATARVRMRRRWSRPWGLQRTRLVDRSPEVVSA
ncbi:phage tail protein [Tsukamurella ocularis]